MIKKLFALKNGLHPGIYENGLDLLEDELVDEFEEESEDESEDEDAFENEDL